MCNVAHGCGETPLWKFTLYWACATVDHMTSVYNVTIKWQQATVKHSGMLCTLLNYILLKAVEMTCITGVQFSVYQNKRIVLHFKFIYMLNFKTLYPIFILSLFYIWVYILHLEKNVNIEKQILRQVISPQNDCLSDAQKKMCFQINWLAHPSLRKRFFLGGVAVG